MQEHGQGFETKWQSLENEIKNGEIASSVRSGLTYGVAIGAAEGLGYLAGNWISNVSNQGLKGLLKLLNEAGVSAIDPATDLLTGGDVTAGDFIEIIILSAFFSVQNSTIFQNSKLFRDIEKDVTINGKQEYKSLKTFIKGLIKDLGKKTIKKSEQIGEEAIVENKDIIIESSVQSEFVEEITYIKGEENYIELCVGIIENSSDPELLLETLATVDPEAYEEVSKILTSEGKI